MKRILLSALLGAATFFIWGFISWTILHLHDNTLKELPNGADFAEVARQNNLADGAYFYPTQPPPDADSATKALVEQRHEDGPIMTLLYRDAGTKMMDPMIMVKGFILAFIIAFGISYLISRIVESLPSYFSRVLFIATFGILAALATHITGAVWMYHNPTYAIMMALDLAIGWFLAGLVMSLIIKPVHKYSV